jgi:hypothetical protein
LQKAILALPESEYAELRNWFLDEDWERWDKEFEEDVKSGKLDALAAEVLEFYTKGNGSSL